MAEIQIEHNQRSLLAWLLGLALLALLVLGLTLAVAGPGRAVEERVPEIDKAHEKKEDQTPRRLQQWACVSEAEPARAA